MHAADSCGQSLLLWAVLKISYSTYEVYDEFENSVSCMPFSLYTPLRRERIHIFCGVAFLQMRHIHNASNNDMMHSRCGTKNHTNHIWIKCGTIHVAIFLGGWKRNTDRFTI